MTVSSTLPRSPKKLILDQLKKNSNEDVNTLKSIEKILIKKRQSIFKLPPPNSPVILLYSGGIDSTIAWAILMKHFRLNVYPLFLQRNTSLSRLFLKIKSIKHYSSLYRKKYSQYFHQPYQAKFVYPQPKIAKATLASAKLNPKFIFEIYNRNIKESAIEPSGLMTMLAFCGFEYANLLKAKFNIKISTVFSAVLPTDGLAVKSQTATAHRSAMLNICSSLNNYSLQFSSILMEKELGICWSKNDIINWAKLEKIPLEKTWSCNENTILHCGYCLNCQQRQTSSNQVLGYDKTFYLSQLKLKKIKLIIRKLLYD